MIVVGIRYQYAKPLLAHILLGTEEVLLYSYVNDVYTFSFSAVSYYGARCDGAADFQHALYLLFISCIA